MHSLRSRSVLLVLVVLAVFAVDLFAQSRNSRAYRRPTISKGSPKKPLTGPAAGRAVDVAAQFVKSHGKDADLTPSDTADIVVTGEAKTEPTGISHVYLRQRVGGIEVFGADSNVNVGADGAVLSYGTSFLPGAPKIVNGSTPAITAADAANAAAAFVGLQISEPLQTTDVKPGPEQETTLTDGGIASSAIVTKLVYQPVDLGLSLRLAWQIDIDEKSGAHLWRITVDAESGEVLNQEDYVYTDNWDVPGLKPSSDARPYFGLLPFASPTPFIDGSSYRVFAIPKESPNDGPRTLVSNPADIQASPFGWHDTNAVPGPEFTLTRGNNVHAYLDQDANNAADAGHDVDGGATLTFDFPADLNEHAQNYRQAVVANLFYWNNLFHDVLWRYGFNEGAGNFQANNYGRGGTGGDYVRAEAADGNGTNNANFSTPVETPTSGGTPRMQMFLWPGNQFGAQNQVIVNGVTYEGTWSRFSGAPPAAGVSGAVINAGNGCAAADYAAAPAGNWMAIVTGNNTGCSNVEKARRASIAGAKALIVAHTTTAAAPVLTGALTVAPAPTVPVISISLADGNAIRAALPASGTVRKHPNHPGIRDGDFENGIVLHEYGHGVSNRLTGGPAVNCLSGDEQAGEGWSDFFAILMTLNPAVDDPQGRRGMGPYALFQDNRQGGGIRPRPYSRSMEIQPFSYDSIKTAGWLEGASLAIPHGVGHGWAAVLWDMTWDLIDKHGFSADLYAGWNAGGNTRSLQYVIDGLKLQGCAPGFVAARNGIIAAVEARGGQDFCTVWASFARRGLGYSAIQGTTDSDDNTEAYDTHPSCRAGFNSPVSNEPAINVVNAGSNVPLKFSYPEGQGTDILAKHSPYARQVECSTLRTLDPNAQFITPRPLPILLDPTGKEKLSQSGTDYHFNWKTNREWSGTCREVVFTRKDGVQHRAYFLLDAGPSWPVSGYVRDASGAGVPNVEVRIAGSPYGAVTTDATGFYSFLAVARGTYTATASPAGGGGCHASQTQQFTVQGKTTLNFSLPDRVDAFGYSCRHVDASFEQAANLLPLVGDDVSVTIPLPFPMTWYGTSHTQAHVCTNGYVEFVGPTTGTSTCSTSGGNLSIPRTTRPNGAVYGFYDDLLVDALSSIHTELKGESPDRRFVIEFRNVGFFADTPTRRVDFNMILHENGQVLTQYRNIASDPRERGNSATIGTENGAGTIALQYSFNSEVLNIEPALTSIRYVPPPLYSVSGQVRDAGGNLTPNVTVTLDRASLNFTTVTDASGAYSFAAVPAGPYTAAAQQVGCIGQTQSVTISGNTTLNFTLGDFNDTFGYRCRAETAAFEEAANVVPIAGDDIQGVWQTLTFGFPFTFYGQTYSGGYVCANGFIEFASSPVGTTCAFSNATIPSTARPNAAIYSFWDDLFIDAAASVRTEMKGVAPNRRYVVEWRNLHFLGDTTRRVDVNIVLHENGQIQTQYKNIANDGRERGNSATIGIENEAGTVALRFSFNQAVLPPDPTVTTIRYRPPGTP